MAKKKESHLALEQEAMFEFVQMLQQMPAAKREKLLSEFEKFGETGEDMNQDFEKERDYTHFPECSEVHKYTLRVAIRDHKPVIYRKFSVPSNISLRHLSELLTELMGWSGIHLNQFRKKDSYFAPAYQREDEIPILLGPARNYNQEDFMLSDILSEKGKVIEWEYDFGDSWRHDVRLSSIDEYKEGEPLVSFIKGECACPPEDCGGVWGYEELLDIYYRCQKYAMGAGKRPKGDEMDRLSWCGMSGGFNPAHYDAERAHRICDEYCK